MIQEVHGDEVVSFLQESGLLRSHVSLSSHPLDRNGLSKGDASGVAILVDRDLTHPKICVPPQPTVLGTFRLLEDT